MRVVYVVSLFPCWSETFIVREINELIAAGVDVRIVSLKHPIEKLVQSDAKALLDRVIYPRPWLEGSMAAMGELVRRPELAMAELARITGAMATDPARLIKSIVTWWRSLGLAGEVRALQPARLHAHWATYPTTAAQIIAPRAGVPFSFTCHAHDIFVEQQFVGSKLQASDFAVTISRFNVEFLAQRVGEIARQKLHVIHCGVVPADIPYRGFELAGPTDLVAGSDAIEAPPSREPGLIVSVGRHDAIKGFETLVSACALLARRGQAFRCVLVGEGPLTDALRTQIEAAGLSGQFELPGALPGEAVRELLARANLFVLPSRVTPAGDRDGIPVALMEAMAAGTPVVSTTVSGIPELIETGTHGVLVAPDNPEQLAEAIAQQLNAPAQAGIMAAAARERIEQSFDVATESARLLGLFRAAAAGTGLTPGERA